jgi:hypothetical protein
MGYYLLCTTPHSSISGLVSFLQDLGDAFGGCAIALPKSAPRAGFRLDDMGCYRCGAAIVCTEADEVCRMSARAEAVKYKCMYDMGYYLCCAQHPTLRLVGCNILMR